MCHEVGIKTDERAVPPVPQKIGQVIRRDQLALWETERHTHKFVTVRRQSRKWGKWLDVMAEWFATCHAEETKSQISATWNTIQHPVHFHSVWALLPQDGWTFVGLRMNFLDQTCLWEVPPHQSKTVPNTHPMQIKRGSMGWLPPYTIHIPLMRNNPK